MKVREYSTKKIGALRSQTCRIECVADADNSATTPSWLSFTVTLGASVLFVYVTGHIFYEIEVASLIILLHMQHFHFHPCFVARVEQHILFWRSRRARVGIV